VLEGGFRQSPQGISAMQSINVFAVTPVFMTALFGTEDAPSIHGATGKPAWSGDALDRHVNPGGIVWLIGLPPRIVFRGYRLPAEPEFIGLLG
jgi:uncharacterized membrane protein